VDDDAPPGGNGNSWALAFNNLQDAIDALQTGDQIWVAAGTYVPTREETLGMIQTRVFLLTPCCPPQSVSLYGGFAGHETSLSQRDIAANPTILSADLERNDIDGLVVGTNASRIMRVSSSRTIDGFIFESARTCALTIQGGEATLRNLTFRRNQGSTTTGGAIHYSTGNYVLIDRCEFRGNFGNTGAVSRSTAGTGFPMIIANSIFDGNQTSSGGGAVFAADGSVVLINCLLVHNQASFNGTFGGGGAIYANGSGPSAPSITLHNCTVAYNEALSPSGLGGGIRLRGASSLTTYNTIYWGNSDTTGTAELAQIRNDGTGNRDVFRCAIQDAVPNDGTVPFGGAARENIDLDPLFVAPGANFRLLPGSPCIDRGRTDYVPADTYDFDGDGNTAEPIPIDLDGNPRFLDDPDVGSPGFTVDLGCYEGTDCNGNGVYDLTDVMMGTSADCNGNGRPDECEISQSSSASGGPYFCMSACDPDCNDNGVPDSCDLAACDGSAACSDCNGNNVPDSCDIDAGFSGDCDTDGRPDECTPLPGLINAYWRNGAPGDWNVAANWCPPVIPDNSITNTFDVTIAQAGAVVNLNMSPTLNSLLLETGCEVAVSDASGADVRTIAVTGAVTSTGRFSAADRERMVIDTPLLMQTGGGALVSDDQVAGTGEAAHTSVIEINGGQVVGGEARTFGAAAAIHLIGGAELVDVVVSGVVVPDGQNGNFSGIITNEQLILVGRTGSAITNLASADGTLMGIDDTDEECLRLSGTATARLGDFLGSFTNAGNHIIDGSGIIFGGFDNDGMIRANNPAFGQELILFPPGIKTSSGVLTATDGGTLRVAADVYGTGCVEAFDGRIIVSAGAGSTFLSAGMLAMAGDGMIVVDDNSELVISGPVHVDAGGSYVGIGGANDESVLAADSVMLNGGLMNPPVAGGEIELSGGMRLEVAADMLLDGNGGGGCGMRGAAVTDPSIRVVDRAVLDVRGSMRLIHAVDFQLNSVVAASLGGDFSNEVVVPDCFDLENGQIRLDGSTPQTFEAAGVDFGASSAGHMNNYALGVVACAAGSEVTFGDDFDNSPEGVPGAMSDCEALYAHDLRLEAGALITIAGVNVYFDTMVNAASSVTVLTGPNGCGRLEQVQPGDGDRNGVINEADYAIFHTCLNGPTSAGYPPGCGYFDLDFDGDIDLHDFTRWQRLPS
jgi:hypothetical protein